MNMKALAVDMGVSSVRLVVTWPEIGRKNNHVMRAFP